MQQHAVFLAYTVRRLVLHSGLSSMGVDVEFLEMSASLEVSSLSRIFRIVGKSLPSPQAGTPWMETLQSHGGSATTAIPGSSGTTSSAAVTRHPFFVKFE